MNARSLIKNKEEIEELIIKPKRPCIIPFSETRLINEIEDSEISIPGYKYVRCDSEKRTNGGVIMYIRNDIDFKLIVNEKIINNCWTIGIKINCNGFDGIIITTYHSPKANHSIFRDNLEDICERMSRESKCICIGDLKILIQRN